MAPNDTVLDLKDWPLEEPVSSRRVPGRAEIEAMLEIVRNSLSSVGAARDLLEDISVTAIGKTYEKWRMSGQPWEQLTGYAIVAARNELRDHFRRSNRETALDEQAVDHLVSAVEGGYAEVEVNDWMSKLPEIDQLLIKKKMEGFTQSEVAQSLGMSQSAVSQRMKTLHKRIRVHLLWTE